MGYPTENAVEMVSSVWGSHTEREPLSSPQILDGRGAGEKGNRRISTGEELHEQGRDFNARAPPATISSRRFPRLLLGKVGSWQLLCCSWLAPRLPPTFSTTWGNVMCVGKWSRARPPTFALERADWHVPPSRSRGVRCVRFVSHTAGVTCLRVVWGCCSTRHTCRENLPSPPSPISTE